MQYVVLTGFHFTSSGNPTQYQSGLKAINILYILGCIFVYFALLFMAFEEDVTSDGSSVLASKFTIFYQFTIYTNILLNSSDAQPLTSTTKQLGYESFES